MWVRKENESNPNFYLWLPRLFLAAHTRKTCADIRQGADNYSPLRKAAERRLFTECYLEELWKKRFRNRPSSSSNYCRKMTKR
jgi:hypothetical protein